MNLVYLGLSWLAGTYLGAKLPLAVCLLLAGVVAALVIPPLWRRYRALILVMLCLSLFLGAALRFQSLPQGDELQKYQGMVQLKGVVSADPEPGDRITTLYLKAREICPDGEWKKVSGTCLVYVPKFKSPEPSREFPFYKYGDLLTIEGKLELPPEGEDFSFREYLSQRGIYSIMRYPQKVELLESGKGFKPLEWVYRLRASLSGALDRVLGEPQNSLAQGILLGKRGSIPQNLKNALATTGTTHIIAISGMNLSIVAGIVISLAAWVFGRHRPTYFLLALATIWGYAILTGMPPSAFRAAIMVSLWLSAYYLGRPNSAITSLVLAAALMVGLQPRVLWDIGFQLSCAAMAGLIFLAPKLQALGRDALAGKADWAASLGNLLTDSFSVTLAAVIFTLPIIAFDFHRIPVVGLPATVLILLTLPLILVTVALAGGTGLFLLPLAQAIGWVAWLFLTYTVVVIEAFSRVPLASVEVPKFNEAAVWACYIALAAALWIASRPRFPNLLAAARQVAALPGLGRQLSPKWLIPPLIIIAVPIWIFVGGLPDSRLHVSFLDVGQGDAILIQKSGRAILVDGGSSPQAITSELGKKLPFWQRSLDLVVLTHPDNDHLTGLVEVLRRYQVKQVLEGVPHQKPLTYQEWTRLIEDRGIKRTIAQMGQRIDLSDGAWIEVLNPESESSQYAGSDPDNYSVVLRLVAGEVSFLLTGDIREEAEANLIDLGLELRSTVLKVGHHGSETSTSPDFLSEVDPQLAVVSVGAGNRFEHPRQEVLDRLNGIQVYRTDNQGTIELITDGKRLWVKAGGSRLQK